MPEEREL